MKITIKVVVIAALMLGIIAALLAFGFSDWGSTYSNIDIWQSKPWRPFARLAFSFIMISITCLFGGALIKSSFLGK